MISPLCHENVRDTMMNIMNDGLILPSMSDVDISNGVVSRLQDASSFVRAVSAKLNRFTKYQHLHRQSMEEYVTLTEQARRMNTTDDKKNDGNEKLELDQKLECLFLKWFKVPINSNRETKILHGGKFVFESEEFSVLGPSGHSIQVELAFDALKHRYDGMDGVRDATIHCIVKLLVPAENKTEGQLDEMEGSSNFTVQALDLYHYEVSSNFVSDLNNIRKHLGIQHLCSEALWDCIVEQIDIDRDDYSYDYYEEMKFEMQQMFDE